MANTGLLTPVIYKIYNETITSIMLKAFVFNFAHWASQVALSRADYFLSA